MAGSTPAAQKLADWPVRDHHARTIVQAGLGGQLPPKSSLSVIERLIMASRPLSSGAGGTMIRKEFTMIDFTGVVDRYIAIWNETDPARRRDLVGQTWTDDATYVDPLVV